jgi:tol-pal system protein YbgF
MNLFIKETKMKCLKGSLFFIAFMASPFLAVADVPAPVVDATSVQTGWVAPSSGGQSKGGDSASQVSVLQNQMDSLKQSLSDIKLLLQAQGQEIQQLESQQKELFQKTTQPVSSSPVVQATSGAVPEEQVSAPEKSLYDQAITQIQNKQYSDAIATMKTYLGKYSTTGHYVANAHYWLGQLYAVAGMNDKAREELIVVVNNYPSSDKAPDSLLKLGQIASDNNEISQAKQYWQQIMDQYANSAAARTAAVQLQKLQPSNL